jgi:hypothetical protein
MVASLCIDGYEKMVHDIVQFMLYIYEVLASQFTLFDFVQLLLYNLLYHSSYDILHISMGEKAMWDKANVKHFCDLCKIEVLAGHMPLCHLNKVGWKNVEEKFAEKTKRKLDHLQFKNKWDSLKRGYTCFMELKNVATGLGWDEAKQIVDCDYAWWQENLVVSVTTLDCTNLLYIIKL